MPDGITFYHICQHQLDTANIAHKLPRLFIHSFILNIRNLAIQLVCKPTIEPFCSHKFKGKMYIYAHCTYTDALKCNHTVLITFMLIAFETLVINWELMQKKPI